MNTNITPELYELADKCIQNSNIDPALYTEHKVNRGLRDQNGKGVLTGLTEISTMYQNKIIDGVAVPCDGELYYRGININALTDGFLSDNRFGFEETVYLLLFGALPNKKELEDFNAQLVDCRRLPNNFVRDVIMKAPGSDIMNSLARSVLMLSAYDKAANDISIPNVLRQCLQLISIFPLLTVYAYQAYRHKVLGKSLFIHNPKPELSTAENILRLLRPDKKYTELEAKILDLALVLHAEHGGGNNSTFTTHVVTSSGTDTYSSTAASLCSLKGPKHGGANLKVQQMFEVIKKEVRDWTDDEQVAACIRKIVNKEIFDKAGLVYGIGHAVYTVSDPREKIFEKFVEQLAAEKDKLDEYNLYMSVARLAPEIISSSKGGRMHKVLSPNIDFFSGLVYSMLGLPIELYTPIFAVARIAGWSAHRIEELINSSRIIRPAYMSVQPETEYIPMDKR